MRRDRCPAVSYCAWPAVSVRGGEYDCRLYTVELENGKNLLAAYGTSRYNSCQHYKCVAVL